MNMELIGKNIAKLRKDNGYTQESLSTKLNVSAQAVSKWETGIGLPEASLLIELADCLNVSIDEIIKPDKKQNRVLDFMSRNSAPLKLRTLDYIPRISRWNPPEGCDMFYSMPAMIAEALCCIDALDEKRSADVTMSEINAKFQDLMHITGIGYGFLWNEKRHIIEELWRVNNLLDTANRVMRYYGRDYLWLTEKDTLPDEACKAIVWSIDRGYPVVMEWAGGIPEFSIITGYEENGQILKGFTYCEECALKTDVKGMFVNPARWNEKISFNILIIGDRIKPTYTDKDSIAYALEVLSHNEISSESYGFEPFITEMTGIGDSAFYKWLEACDTVSNTVNLFNVSNIFTYALRQNSIYTQKCIQSYFKRLGERSGKEIYAVICQIVIATDSIERERNGLEEFKDNPDKHAQACKAHIKNLLNHRENMRGWLKQIYELM